MITVIIAGGSGTRLWPLSTPEYPKHLLKLTGERSLLQQAYDRASRLGGAVYIVTEASHSDHVKAQLPELSDESFLIEPGRRGTGNCIIFALDVINRLHGDDEPIAFVHSDHNIRDSEGYVKSLKNAAESSKLSDKVTLIGIEPTFPSTGFGYIERGEALEVVNDTYSIESFKEKPDYDTAREYLEAGKYLWNCGYFVGSVGTFLNEIRKVSPELSSNFNSLSQLVEPMSTEYNNTYLAFTDEVIDYALSEKSDNLAVIPARFDWMDLGNFRDLHDAVIKDEDSNYISGENIHNIDVANVYIRNDEPSKPVAVIGMDNVVIVNTPAGLLITRKDVAHRNGEIAKKIQK